MAHRLFSRKVTAIYEIKTCAQRFILQEEEGGNLVIYGEFREILWKFKTFLK